MERKRVAIVGMGSVSPYGLGNTLLWTGLKFNVTRPVYYKPIKVSNTKTSLFPVANVPSIVIDTAKDIIPREALRTMSPMSMYAFLAVQEAWEQANKDVLVNLNPKDVGAFIGSTLPSVYAYEDVLNDYQDNPKNMPSTLAFKTMTHTASLNITQAMQLGKRVMSPNGACASGLISIALAYETIKFGNETAMICGGTEEYHPYLTMIFNKLGIAAKEKCKPFDVWRDGIVVGEGAGILILEEYQHAIERKANIIGEVLGVGMNCSPNICFSDSDSILQCMYLAIMDSPIINNDIDFINAHATGTQTGDIEESIAIETAFTNHINVNSLKGYLGHTMGASGSLELIASILGLQDNLFYKTEGCNIFDSGTCRHIHVNRGYPIVVNPILLKNSFGLGGMNTSVIVQIHTKEN